MAEAKTKRERISTAEKQIMLVVAVAAAIIGVTIVLSIYFIKMIDFQGRVIGEKNKAIVGYETALKNIKTLQTNVYALADNKNLESVASGAYQDECYDSEGDLVNFQSYYENAETEKMQNYYLDLMVSCSALRVIPDALPSTMNEEALMASLNQIFLISDWEPESIAPGGSTTSSAYAALGALPVSLSIEADAAKTMQVLTNIEKSIRAFDISTATVEWGGVDTLTLRARASAYYAEPVEVKEKRVTVYADKSKRTRTQ